MPNKVQVMMAYVPSGAPLRPQKQPVVAGRYDDDADALRLLVFDDRLIDGLNYKKKIYF